MCTSTSSCLFSPSLYSLWHHSNTCTIAHLLRCCKGQLYYRETESHSQQWRQFHMVTQFGVLFSGGLRWHGSEVTCVFLAPICPLHESSTRSLLLLLLEPICFFFFLLCSLLGRNIKTILNYSSRTDKSKLILY
jgi:hypothetical protein